MEFLDDVDFTHMQPMRSAIHDAAQTKYKLFTGKSGKRWLVGDQPNAADNVYVEGGKGSQGFAGATLTFELSDGGSVKLTGPWKVGADGLFSDTGCDVRNKYTSQGVVALERETAKGWLRGEPDRFKKVLHFDPESVIGKFDRVKEIAQSKANQMNRRVWYSVITRGGGTASWVDPSEAR